MIALFTILLFLVPLFLYLANAKGRSSSKKLPPGSLGIPIIGHSLHLLHAMRANTAEKWLQERVLKYGPISKLSLFGKPTVFICGQAANKFVFTSDSTTLSNTQTQSQRTLLGDRTLLDLSGRDHKRVRDTLGLFLKPESLKRYVGKIEEEVRMHIEMHWQGKQEVTVLPLMRTLTFNIISTVLFGIERGARRDKLINWFPQLIGGVWSVPINLPFTRYNRSIKASINIRNMAKELLYEKKVKLEQNSANPRQDLITCMLSSRDQTNGQVMTEEEISDNVILTMAAGYDTSSILLTFMIRLLANEPSIYAAVLREQEEIAKGKSNGEFLTWEDLAKMKYSWRAAMETLRMFPPVFGGFRQAVRDIEYDGYLIPKGWQIFWVANMTHADDSIFREASKFDPTRFENQSSTPPYCLIPFGAGPRICPGYELARIETLVAIHYLVTQFTWKLCADNFFSRVPMPEPTKGLPIQITPKKQK